MNGVSVRLAAGVTGALLLAACTSGNVGRRTVTVTVPPSPSTSATSGPPSSTSAVPAPTKSLSKLRGTCGEVLSDYYVQHALGGAQLGGSTAFVVGVPDSRIGRLSTINCRYGVRGDKTKVEIGVSLYRTAAQASARIGATTGEYTANGASSANVRVAPDGQPAVTGTYLTGGRGSGYELPVLVAASGQRTVAVTIDPSELNRPPAEQAATAVAETALERTAP